MHQLTSANDIIRHLESPLAVTLVYAEWCPFSLSMYDTVEEAERSLSPATIAAICTDIVPDPPIGYQSIPTTLISAHGKIISTLRGARNGEELRAQVARVVKVISAPTTQQVAFDLRLELSGSANRDQFRVIVHVTDTASGDLKGHFELDRSCAHIALFFAYAQQSSSKEPVLQTNGLTGHGRRIVSQLKRELGVRRLAVLERTRESRDAQYIPKNISRLNRVAKTHLGANLIDRQADVYVVTPLVRLILAATE